MTADEERLLRRYHDFLRSMGYAVCAPATWSATASTTLAAQHSQIITAWVSLTESGGTLIERFGAWMDRQDQDGEQRARWQRDEEDEGGQGDDGRD